jgi:hypothetical protein
MSSSSPNASVLPHISLYDAVELDEHKDTQDLDFDDNFWDTVTPEMQAHRDEREREAGLASLIRKGNVKETLKSIRMGEKLNHRHVAAAIQGGHVVLTVVLIDSLSQRGSVNLDWLLRTAAIYNRVYIMNILHNLGATALNWAMRFAAYNGSMEAMEWCLRRGATRYHWCLRYCKDWHPKLAEVLRETQKEVTQPVRDGDLLRRSQKYEKKDMQRKTTQRSRLKVSQPFGSKLASA